jgi:DNA-binding transcriptional regulator GbsR (MarR family)
MDIQEGRGHFIEAWGKMATDWGVNKTMAQVHALLLISSIPLSASDVQEQLDISVGNTNMNIRALLDWGLIHRQSMLGERKDFFYAEKDIWKVVTQIMLNRKKKELEPLLKVLNELADVKENCSESENFCKVVADIRTVAHRANTTLDFLIKAESSHLLGTLLNRGK